MPEVRAHVLCVRLSVAEMERVRVAAGAYSVSDWLRELVLEEVERSEYDDRR